jgi:ABC-type bacteriocin/lantibiotic exporter with double-glycine peptidase domain
MILAYFGREIDERSLADLLRTRAIGTPADNIIRLESLGYKVTLGRGIEFDLGRFLKQRLPVIVFVKTQYLPYWDREDAHALVLVGRDASQVYVNDPAFDSAPHAIPLDSLLLAWSEFDYKYAVITPA